MSPKKRIGQSAPNVQEVRLKKSTLQEENSNLAQSATGNQDLSEADENREKEQALDVEILKEVTDDELRKELKRFLIPKLRSASYRWKFRSDAIKAARIRRGIYECALCKCEMKNGEFKVDHIIPVVALDGWDGNWDTYVNRMFVKAEQFQVICDICHTIKSDTEVQLRKLNRERKKLVDKG